MAKSKKPSVVVSSVGTASGRGQALGASSFQMHTSLPPEHALNGMIRRITAEWAYAEYILDGIIWELADISPSRGGCVTAFVSGFKNKCDAILALISDRGGNVAIVTKINKMIKNSHDPRQRRNRVVHDPWFLEHQSNTTAQFGSVDRKIGMKSVNSEFLTDTLNLIAKTHQEAASIRFEVTNWLASLQDK